MLSEIQVRPVRHHVHVNSNSGVIVDTRDSGSEKWRTKKKVEIVTTKNVEKTIKRQLVLEDGRVLDEDIPIVTLDTTENKEIFETDHDEERDNLDYNKRAEMNTGDKVMTLKTTKDVKENVTKTEASHNIGSIANRDIPTIMRDKKRLGKVIRTEKSQSRELVPVVPVVVQNSRSHTTVTDTEQVKERSFKRNGKILCERVKTEQHEVYESNDSETSDDESDFEKIEYEELELMEPREYKTKTEESFIEYFQKGQNQKDKRLPCMGGGGGRGHYKTESKQFNKNNSTSGSGSPRRQLQQSRSWDNDREDKLGRNTTSSSSMSRQYSNSLGDLTKNGHERVFIAKVIDETPTVKLRNKKKQDISKYMEHRQSANFSSSGSAMKSSSRCSTPTSREYRFPNCRVKDHKRERPMSLDITNKFYYSGDNQHQQYQKQTTESRQSYNKSNLHDYSSNTLGRQRNYHSSLDLSDKPQLPRQIEITIESPSQNSYKLVPKQHYSSSDNLLNSSTSLSSSTQKQICTKSLVKKGGKFQSVGDICFTTSKEIPNVGREIAINKSAVERKGSNDRKISGQLIFTSEKQHSPSQRSLETNYKTSSCTNLSTRVIPIEFSGAALSTPSSPATKYRTRVAVHGAA